MMKAIYLQCVIAFFASISVHAQTANIPLAPSTPGENTKLPGNCFEDGKKFCFGLVVGKGWLKCMAKFEEQISDGCRIELTALAENWRNTFPDWVAVRKDCRKILDEDCKRAAQTQSKESMLYCMKEFSMKLDNDCKLSMNEYVRRKEAWDKKNKK
ncbi:MAG: hypothetical protein JNL01_03420 [Bdellovibrionales bacterium]|nr:hypothetical protein [Bdellovibrionales bacterium]